MPELLASIIMTTTHPQTIIDCGRGGGKTGGTL
jgi:hypothetical protein